jgi:hypothetical protein
MTGRHLPCRSSTLGDLRLAVALWLTEGRNLRLDLVFRLDASKNSGRIGNEQIHCVIS